MSCLFCSTKVPRKDRSTGGLVHHLKRHHNFVSKYNAWKVFEELSLIKDKRLQSRIGKNDASTDERPTKQQKLVNCLPMKYSNQHPQHIKITNSISSMICHDAAPVNIVKRPGMVHLQCPDPPRLTVFLSCTTVFNKWFLIR